MTTTAQPEQTSSIGRLHKKFAIARWLQGSSMLQSSLMSISKLLSVLTEMNSGRPNLSVSKFSTTTVDNFVDYSSWCRGDQPQRHVSADRLNSRHRKFISVHDLHATRFFSGMGHSLAKGRAVSKLLLDFYGFRNPFSALGWRTRGWLQYSNCQLVFPRIGTCHVP